MPVDVFISRHFYFAKAYNFCSCKWVCQICKTIGIWYDYVIAKCYHYNIAYTLLFILSIPHYFI